jgi:hypothetical protein
MLLAGVFAAVGIIITGLPSSRCATDREGKRAEERFRAMTAFAAYTITSTFAAVA